MNRITQKIVCGGLLLMFALAAKAQTPTPTPTPTPPNSENTVGVETRTSPSLAAGGNVAQPSFQPLRYNENYRYLADASQRREWLDRLKYIPLWRGHEDWYLTIGGEARLYYERVTNPGFGDTPTDDSGYLLQRYMLHTDWHLGKNARVFFQLKSGIENGREGGPRPAIDRNDLDVHQAFFDYSFSFKAKDQAATAAPSLLLRVGRQEMTFGAQRLVSAREGPNVRRSFDGVRLTANVAKWRLDGFAVKEVQSRAGFFDDRPNPQSTFWGAYATRRFASPAALLGETVGLDVYYFGIDLKTVIYNQGSGRDKRHTFGTRVFNTRGQGFDFDYELSGQTGSFRGGAARAWGFGTETGYTFNKVRFQPRVAFRFDGASGDHNPRDTRLTDYNQLYPEGYFFGRLGAIGFLNLYDVHPLVSAQLTKQFSVAAESLFFFRQSLNDTVYNLASFPLRRAPTSRASFTGNQLNFSADHHLDRHTTLSAYYSRFNVGRFFKETPPARDTDYMALFLTYKF